MARLSGVDLPRDKRVEIALTYIFGIGRTRSLQTLEATGVNGDTRVSNLTDEELMKLRNKVYAHAVIGGEPQDLKFKGQPSQIILGDNNSAARLLTRSADGSDNYTAEANQIYAKNLKGKLLLAHGTMDNNVPPYNTLLVVNELIKANKDFDLILLPNRTHGFGNEPYMVRRRWDYFVSNLLGAIPPREYQIGAARARP